MKKFLIKLTIFLGVLVLADVACGLVMDSLFVRAKSGTSRRIAHIAEGTNEDILIFGSSRVVHHYISSIVEDSQGVSCYNCGLGSNGILLFYGFYQMISVRLHRS